MNCPHCRGNSRLDIIREDSETGEAFCDTCGRVIFYKVENEIACQKHGS